MLTKLLQVLFVPKRARAKMSARGPASAQATGGAKTAAPGGSKAGPKSAGGGRDKLLQDTMSLYRQQRQDVYDSLDDATRRQIEEDAEKAFGQALRPKG